MVQLKVRVRIIKRTVGMIFQYLMVQLKDTEGNTRGISILFQYLMVQLKVNYTEDLDNRLIISIPHGTIKRPSSSFQRICRISFQYLMVQLKAYSRNSSFI